MTDRRKTAGGTGMTAHWSNLKEPKAPDDPKYIECVKQLPCVICEAFGEPYGQPPSDAHHTISNRNSMARRPDKMAIPLCKGHHQTGENGKLAIHRGKETWEAKYGLDTDYIDITQDRVFVWFGRKPKEPKK